MNQSTTTTRPTGSVSRGVRLWVIAAGVATLMLGAWAFFMPEGFFNDFPISGAHWVSTLGEFNDHLMRDYGAAQIGLGLAALMVAAKRSRDGVIALMTGFVVFGALHLGYHFTTFDHFHTGSAVAQAVALSTFIVIPLGVLLTLRRQPS